MDREHLPPYPTASYVLPEWRTVYVSVPKAACTSLKWLVAGLQGEDPQRFHRSLSREVTRAMCIHRRDLWQHTPKLHDLPDEELARIAPDGDWFVFAVVRQPGARLFSGWQSKFLLREPRWVEEFGDAPWFPREPRSTADVVEDFRRFAVSLTEEPDQPVMKDRHFRPQTRLLRPHRVPYTRIYDTSEIPQLLGDLREHLRAQGNDVTLELPESNETPLQPLRSMFGEEVSEAVRTVYADDFTAFGYDAVMPAKARDEDYADSLLKEVGRLVERGERVGDLAKRAQALQRARKRASAPAAADGSLLGRARRRLAGKR